MNTTIYEMLKNADKATLQASVMSMSESLEELALILPVQVATIKNHIKTIVNTCDND